MVDLVINNKKNFQLAIREGMSFYYACRLSGNNPKTLSRIIRKDKGFKEECNNLVMASNMDYIIAAADYSEKREWEKAEICRKKAKSIKELVLWGDLGDLKSPEVYDIVIDNVEKGLDLNDIAVGLGCSNEVFDKWYNSNVELQELLPKIK